VADDVARLPGACATCLHWERVVNAEAVDALESPNGGAGEAVEQVKRRWWLESLSAGTVAGVVARAPRGATGNGNSDGNGAGAAVAGYVTYRLPSDGVDALTVLALHVDAGCRGAGLGRALVHQVAREALRRSGGRPRTRAVEALAARVPGTPCLVPLDFWLACGFVVVHEHPLTPRVRLDARVLAGWRTEVGEAVELAWDRLRGVVRPEPAPKPALTLRRR
nr:GNAT family N-acetyltransferase [Nocardioidaceae bacterium]